MVYETLGCRLVLCTMANQQEDEGGLGADPCRYSIYAINIMAVQFDSLSSSLTSF